MNARHIRSFCASILSTTALAGGTRAQAPFDHPVRRSTCTHTGTEWENPRVSNQGGAQCVGIRFSLTIGNDAQGATVSIHFNGCPSFLDVIAGHYKKVQKPQFNAVNAETLPWQRTIYEADCGGIFTSPSCSGGLPSDRAGSSTTWEEEGCDNLR